MLVFAIRVLEGLFLIGLIGCVFVLVLQRLMTFACCSAATIRIHPNVIREILQTANRPISRSRDSVEISAGIKQLMMVSRDKSELPIS